MGFLGGSGGEESACNLGNAGSIPGKIPWRRAWQPTPVFLPGESHGRRSLVGYNPWGRKEQDATEAKSQHASKHISPEENFTDRNRFAEYANLRATSFT